MRHLRIPFSSAASVLRRARVLRIARRLARTRMLKLKPSNYRRPQINCAFANWLARHLLPVLIYWTIKKAVSLVDRKKYAANGLTILRSANNMVRQILLSRRFSGG